MPSHTLDRQPDGGQRLVDELNTLRQQVEQLRTEIMVPILSNTVSASMTLASGEVGVVTMTLSNLDNQPLIGFPNVTFYEGSVAAGNEIGYGDARDSGYQLAFWCDWGGTNNNNVKSKSWIRNNSGSSKTIEFRGNWRYFAAASSSSASG
jgi:hypothetical protein